MGSVDLGGEGDYSHSLSVTLPAGQPLRVALVPPVSWVLDVAHCRALPRSHWLCIQAVPGTWLQIGPASLYWICALQVCSGLAARCPSFGLSWFAVGSCIPSWLLALPGSWAGAAPLHYQCYPRSRCLSNAECPPWQPELGTEVRLCAWASVVSQHLGRLFFPSSSR